VELHLAAEGLLGHLLVASLIHQPVQRGLVHVGTRRHRHVDKDDPTALSPRLLLDIDVSAVARTAHNLSNGGLDATSRLNEERPNALLRLVRIRDLHAARVPDLLVAQFQVVLIHVVRHVLEKGGLADLVHDTLFDRVRFLLDHGVRVAGVDLTTRDGAGVHVHSDLVNRYVFDRVVHALARALRRTHSHGAACEAARRRVVRRHDERVKAQRRSSAKGSPLVQPATATRAIRYERVGGGRGADGWHQG